MTHVASRTRPSLFLRVTLKGGCGLGTRLQLTYNSHVCVHTAEPHSNIYGFTTTVFLNNDLEVLILRSSVSLLEAPFADVLTYF